MTKLQGALAPLLPPKIALLGVNTRPGCILSNKKFKSYTKGALQGELVSGQIGVRRWNDVVGWNEEESGWQNRGQQRVGTRHWAKIFCIFRLIFLNDKERR